jgi:EcoRII C terminal/Restriction endonuclease EcoRII, N-terminal
MKNIETWVDEHISNDCFFYIKRLSGNDTGLTKAHQAGPYIPKSIIFYLFSSLESKKSINPRLDFDVVIDSHSSPDHSVNVIWYNNKVIANGTRNECRVTGWGGSNSPLLDPDSTGSICVFCFNKPSHSNDSTHCNIWLCNSLHDEDVIENVFGIVEPGNFITYNSEEQISKKNNPCILDEISLPEIWMKNFPTGVDVVEKSIELTPKLIHQKPGSRLLSRRKCEYEVFLSIERHWTLPLISDGFSSVNDFIKLANSVANRRKSRAGRSLEIQAKTIFKEENLILFAHDKISEGKKRPDFLFPSVAAYRDMNFPEENLRMLAVKTTCKDRWRQVLSEADRIKNKHLLTLQEGVSINQYNEMKKEGVILVVPESLHNSFPQEIRPNLKKFEDFITETKLLYSA